MAQEDSIASLQTRIKAFSEAREWDQFHTPKNLIMAATSEMGELAEVLQWKSDTEAHEFLQSHLGAEFDPYWVKCLDYLARFEEPALIV